MPVGTPEQVATELKKIMGLRPVRSIQPNDIVSRFCGYLALPVDLEFDCEVETKKILDFFDSFKPSYCEGKQQARCAAIAIAHASTRLKCGISFDQIEKIAEDMFNVSTECLKRDIRNLKSKSSKIGTLLNQKFPVV